MIWFLLSTAYEFLWFLLYNPQNNLRFSEFISKAQLLITILIPDTTHTKIVFPLPKFGELWLLIALKTTPICGIMCIKSSRY